MKTLHSLLVVLFFCSSFVFVGSQGQPQFPPQIPRGLVPHHPTNNHPNYHNYNHHYNNHHRKSVPLPKSKLSGNLICYSCKLDFRKQNYEWDHPCLGRHNNFTVDDNYLVYCGPREDYCKVERTEVNGVLVMLKRECTDICYESCRLRGFGVNYELCEKCCKQDGCNMFYPTSVARISKPFVVLMWGVVCVVIMPKSFVM